MDRSEESSTPNIRPFCHTLYNCSCVAMASVVHYFIYRIECNRKMVQIYSKWISVFSGTYLRNHLLGHL